MSSSAPAWIMNGRGQISDPGSASANSRNQPGTKTWIASRTGRNREHRGSSRTCFLSRSLKNAEQTAMSMRSSSGTANSVAAPPMLIPHIPTRPMSIPKRSSG